MEFDPRPYADRIREENRAYDAEVTRKRVEAMEEARRLAAAFAEADADLRRVVLFGSLLPGRDYRLGSDIDLAVEGGDIGAFLSIAESSRFEVDVVELSSLRAGVAERVSREGTTLYEKD